MAVGPVLPNDSSRAVEADSGQSGKPKEAARQFEALMIAQMLKSVREASAGTFDGTGENQSNDSILEMAEQQLSQVLAASGGLGLAKLVISGLPSKSTATGGDQ